MTTATNPEPTPSTDGMMTMDDALAIWCVVSYMRTIRANAGMLPEAGGIAMPDYRNKIENCG